MTTLSLVESKTGFVRLELAEESLKVGTCRVDIKSGGYRAKGELSLVGGQLRRFYNVMAPVLKAREGTAVFFDSDCLLEIHYSFVSGDKIDIKGRFQADPHMHDELKFQLDTDRSDVAQMLQMMREFLEHDDR